MKEGPPFNWRVSVGMAIGLVVLFGLLFGLRALGISRPVPPMIRRLPPCAPRWRHFQPKQPRRPQPTAAPTSAAAAAALGQDLAPASPPLRQPRHARDPRVAPTPVAAEQLVPRRTSEAALRRHRPGQRTPANSTNGASDDKRSIPRRANPSGRQSTCRPGQRFFRATPTTGQFVSTPCGIRTTPASTSKASWLAMSLPEPNKTIADCTTTAKRDIPRFTTRSGSLTRCGFRCNRRPVHGNHDSRLIQIRKANRLGSNSGADPNDSFLSNVDGPVEGCS